MVGGSPRGLELVGRPNRRTGSGPRPSRWHESGWETLSKARKLSEALPVVWKWSGDPPKGSELVGGSPGGPELVGRPSRRSRIGPRLSQWSGSGCETFLEVRKWSEALSVVQKWLGDPPGGTDVFGRPTWISGSGRETLPEVRKWSRDLHRGP